MLAKMPWAAEGPGGFGKRALPGSDLPLALLSLFYGFRSNLDIMVNFKL